MEKIDTDELPIIDAPTHLIIAKLNEIIDEINKLKGINPSNHFNGRYLDAYIRP